MKAFRWRIFWCVAPVVVSLVVVGFAAWNKARSQSDPTQPQGMTFKLGVDLVGGTILVYEVDVAKFKEGKLPDGYKPEQLITALKRRIDPADLYNVTIRPLSTTRVEIILPTGGTHSEGEGQRTFTTEEVQKVKELISEVGSLEFRILAHDSDDAAGIEAVKKYFDGIKDNPERLRELEEANKVGKPPPAPKAEDKAGFPTDKGLYNYSWMEMGRSYRADFGFDNAAEGDHDDKGNLTARGQAWQQAKEARDNHKIFQRLDMPGRPYIYSREVPANRQTGEDKKKKIEYFVLTRDTQEGKDNPGKYVDRAAEGANLTVTFGLKSQGGELMGELTGNNVDRQMAIVLDGLIMSSANIHSKITTDGEITGRFTKDQTDRLVTILRSGALPASLKPVPVSENTMGPTLGADTIISGMLAVLLAFAAILLFMLVYYRFAGMVACIALFANLLLTIAFMVLVSATFTLPGLAGLVLMLGMAVDANVLIYERLREERARGASIGLAIRNGYDRAFPTIIDTHLSSIFTAIVLYIVGNDQLKGFGISLTVGLIISLFTSLYMTRLMFDLWQSKGWLHELKMMDLKNFPVFRWFLGKNIDFMRIRYYWFAATTILTILGATLFLVRGKQGLNIDFTGGTAITYELNKLMTITEVRDKLDEREWPTKLKVEKAVPVDGADGYKWEITYAGDAKPRLITLPTADRDAKDVEARARELPDMSVEQIFMAAGDYSTGNASKVITVRTPEMAPEMVQLVVSRLLDTDLRRIFVVNPKVSDDNRAITLEFDDPNRPKLDEPTFASPTQVTTLLQREFKALAKQLEAEGKTEEAAVFEKFSQQISVSKTEDAKEKESEGLFDKMVVRLPEIADANKSPEERAQQQKQLHAKLEQIIAAAQAEFSEHPQPWRLENFDSQLAADTQTRALTAILLSWLAILLYLWFRFGNWTFGAATVICLIHDLFFTLGFIALCHFLHQYFPTAATFLGLHDFKIDLPTIAALLTLVGYSVNDTIVVFDRIREVRGKNPLLTPQMINDGVNQTLSRTLLTSFSVWIVVFVLYVFGGAGVHLFAFVMVVGVIVGTYSSIYIASPLLLIFGEGVPAKPKREQPREVTAARG
jgi:SecD/SecF fusion protein